MLFEYNAEDQMHREEEDDINLPPRAAVMSGSKCEPPPISMM